METNVTRRTIDYLRAPESHDINNMPLFLLRSIYKNNLYINKKSLHHILNTTPTFYQTKIKNINKSKDKNKDKDKDKDKNELLECLYTNSLIELGLVNVIINPKNVNQIILKPSKLGKAFITYFKKDIIDKNAKLDIFLTILLWIALLLDIYVVIAVIIASLSHMVTLPIGLFFLIIAFILIIPLRNSINEFNKLPLYEHDSLNRYIKENDIVIFFKKELSSKKEINNDIETLTQYKICKK